VPVAPLTSAHDAPEPSHRRHWYAYEVGDPDQLPADAESDWPALALPLIVGNDAFDGAETTGTEGAAATGAVGSDVAVDDPFLFEPVTTTRSVEPTSAVAGEYVDAVAPARDTQAEPVPSQRDHW
jgi:hypothetical protein